MAMATSTATSFEVDVDSARSRLHPDPRGSDNDDAQSSGTATPLPEDAPPSAISISHARRARKRIFPTIYFESRVSHFDAESRHHDFRGFFALFWIGLFIMVLTTALRNLKETGKVLRTSIFSLFVNAPLELAIADLAMVLSCGFCLPAQQRLVKAGDWAKVGCLLQHATQAVWLAVWVYLPFFLGWQWTHQVFFTLHALTLLMKIHSYSFYCGHLSECYKQLRAMDSDDTDTESEEKAELRDKLAFELTSPSGRVTYPQNLTLNNFVDYMLCPTLCYELSYPRTERVRWNKVAEKAAAVFGCIFLLTVVSEEFILPVMNEAAISLDNAKQFSEVALILLESISLLLFPFMVTFLLVFLVIFEYVLGAFAEITCFGDRHFYSDWWNSTDWLEFSREWNVPVHSFLQRHVYGVSRRNMPRNVAIFVTFLISALAHELVMFCITKKLRGYGFVCQMLQLPIIAIQRTKIMRERRTFNNVMFWCSMIYGLSMVSAPPLLLSQAVLIVE
ncbi:MBOAT, membrane-bound O-acyltransferase family-domain-containing protein [Sphaerosporella brunnea]|uniref:O-acyltransferase n=1 Tax=Sphaerosporella brunnea TaxID=1250544 RepID=A0A5J5F7E6_9PEZI|nr:MBOAT, membrane-bound O-acyltransferase family-domain-containing protein [Sphaerosporella brunnea]